MEKRKFNLIFKNMRGDMLECRQCVHSSCDKAAHEADLYRDWAEYHYGCRVFYTIIEQ